MIKFNRAEGLAAKEDGMERAAEARNPVLEEARKIARRLGSGGRPVCADDVAKLLDVELGPAAGSLFRGPEWQWTGTWNISTQVRNHGRLQRIWKRKY